MVDTFVNETFAQRVRFGPGERYALAAELAGLGAQRVFVVVSPSVRGRVTELIDGFGEVTVWEEIAAHARRIIRFRDGRIIEDAAREPKAVPA
jgi:hypothetical protein